jgi:hypothetical protein
LLAVAFAPRAARPNPDGLLPRARAEGVATHPQRAHSADASVCRSHDWRASATAIPARARDGRNACTSACGACRFNCSRSLSSSEACDAARSNRPTAPGLARSAWVRRHPRRSVSSGRRSLSASSPQIPPACAAAVPTDIPELPFCRLRTFPLPRRRGHRQSVVAVADDAARSAASLATSSSENNRPNGVVATGRSRPDCTSCITLCRDTPKRRATTLGANALSKSLNAPSLLCVADCLPHRQPCGEKGGGAPLGVTRSGTPPSSHRRGQPKEVRLRLYRPPRTPLSRGAPASLAHLQRPTPTTGRNLVLTP